MFRLLLIKADKQNYLNPYLYWYIHNTTPTVFRNKFWQDFLTGPYFIMHTPFVLMEQ